ncbi:MAG: benzoyl-CoA reductase, bzd-type, subunit N [Calditrichota bacterium]
MFYQFKQWYEDRHSYARAWKERTGGQVMGCFCSYAPEEILVAANWLPVRILGSHEPQDVAEKHIFGMFCPFCRDVLAQGLKGRYEYLDGILMTQSCIHLRQSFMSWKLHVPTPFEHYIYMPMKVQTPHAIPYHRSELVKFRDALQKFNGKPISDADLDRGIAVVNENRRLMREVYEYRKGSSPKLTGTEAMWMTVSSMWVDKEEHSAEIRKVLAQLPNRPINRSETARLMLIGSENDDIPFIEMVERVGATVVMDEHCTGTRYFWNLCDGGEDRMTAIAERYIRRPACPAKDWEERTRFDHILRLAKDWEVAGAIIIQQKFCDPHEADMVPLRAFLNDNGIPNLMLEFDATMPLGPFRIRVEAFLEMIGQEDLF